MLTITKLFEWYKGHLTSIWGQLNTALLDAEQLPFNIWGKTENFDVWKTEIEGPNYFYIVITTREKDRGQIIGGALFAKEFDNIFSVMGVELSNEYRNRGIGINLYVSICIHFGINIINSIQLSETSEKLWLSLLNNPRDDIDIRVFDKKLKKEFLVNQINTIVDGVLIKHPIEDNDMKSQRFFLMIKPKQRISLGPLNEHHKTWVYRKPDFNIFPSLTKSWSLDNDD